MPAQRRRAVSIHDGLLPHDPGRRRSAILSDENTAPVFVRTDIPRTFNADFMSQVPNEDDEGEHEAEESYLANLDMQQQEDFDATLEDEEEEDDEDEDVDGEGDTKLSDDGEQEEEDAGEDDESSFDASATGLKEISNLACFTVSSYKPGCGVKELRSDDMNQYWQ